MNQYEEQLQNDLERGEMPQGDELDVRSYRQVFQALKKDPGHALSEHFAERVVAALITRQQSKDSRAYFWFAIGIMLLIIACLGTIIFIGYRFDLGFLRAMSDYKGLAVFGVVFVLIINWLDKRLVKEGRLSY